MELRHIRHWVNFWKVRIEKCRQHGWTYHFDRKYRDRIKTWERNKKNAKNYGYTYSDNKPYIKKILLDRDGKECFWCGGIINLKDATIDHIKPVREVNRNNRLNNLRLIHDNCRVQRDMSIQKGTLKV